MEAHYPGWTDEAAGRLVRPYTLTGGRTQVNGELFDLVSFVLTVVDPVVSDQSRMQPEHMLVLDLCRMPLSVVDVASRLDLPVGVVRVLLGDLLIDQLITVQEPVYQTQLPDVYTLEAVLDGLKAL